MIKNKKINKNKQNATLSLCMIVKNEEKVLERCLHSVDGVFDEIIIVDTGSTDSTINIAKKYTNKVFEIEWIDDFSYARNFSFSKATSDYIMWLDADDVVSDINRKKLIEIKSNNSKDVDVYMLKYNTAFDENNKPTFSYYRERILKRTMNFKWKDEVHEAITPRGNIKYCDIEIEHRSIKNVVSDRNLRIYEKIISSGKILTPRQKFYYSRELYYNEKYDEAIKSFNEFINSNEGWVENSINACLDLSYCYIVKKDLNNALVALFKSFLSDNPRAEIVCQIGYVFQLRKQYNLAIYWYKQALSIPINQKSGAFCMLDAYNYLPCIELCVCYYNLGDIENSIKYNNLAGKYKPNDKSYLNNLKFFQENNFIKS